MSKAITTQEQDYSKWYNDIVVQADLADHSAVRGCMVIKPHGYAIWEKMQAALDKMFKDTGHVNAYFPLFIPKSLFEAEEKNAEGFAKECAVVTHYRLKNDPNNPGKLVVDPEAKLEEIGMRPGEKLHEEMISADDSRRTIILDNRFVVTPVVAEWGYVEPDGARMAEGTAYKSDTNDMWMSEIDIKNFIKNN